MRGYGLPDFVDVLDSNDDIVEKFGLKNGCSEEKRNAGIKRNIRKAQKHSERFKSKLQIKSIVESLGY